MVLVLTIAALSLIGVREFAVAVRAWDDMTQEGSRMRLHNMARLVSHIAVLVLLFGIGWELATLHNIVLNDNAGNTVLSTSDVVAKWCLIVGLWLLAIAGFWKLIDLLLHRSRDTASASLQPTALAASGGGFQRGVRGATMHDG